MDRSHLVEEIRERCHPGEEPLGRRGGRTDRYEVRRFGAGEALQAAVRERFAETGRDRSVDVYLLDPDRPGLSVKLRDGRLSVKRRVEGRDGLERWHPEAELALPVDPHQSRRWLSGVFAAGVADPERLARAAARAGYVTLEVRKRRRRLVRGVVVAEIAEVETDRGVEHTVALESISAEALLAELAALGADPSDNVSYVEWILEGASEGGAS